MGLVFCEVCIGGLGKFNNIMLICPTAMKLHIKNMVCHRCKLAVEQILLQSGYRPQLIELGEVNIAEALNPQQLKELNLQLRHIGFELIDDRKSQLMEKIKNLVVQLVHHTEEPLPINLSAYISGQLHYEYNYLSSLFSETEGITIEKYYISQKIEKVKELLIYDELSLSEIAHQLGYSSVAYLSNQFKKETGLTPTRFKHIRESKRRNIEEL
jgi:AraC-like DNA-binding protein